jgi:lysozyme family protein
VTDYFPKFIDWLMGAEGGYVNDKLDRGGETKYGISKKSYPNVDIVNLTKEEAAEIYRKDYWIRSGADKENFPLAMALADTAVLHGVGTARHWLKATRNWRVFLQLRKERYDEIVAKDPTQRRFLDGWRNRTNNLSDFINKGIQNGTE